jgi:cytochrome c oxidase assembly protein subunit 15
MSQLEDRRGVPGTQTGLFLYAVFVAAALVFLLLAGAMVTSTGSGLSVPDWPLSFGQVMPPMEGGVFYEHGHRMVATGIGVLVIGLAVWLQLRDPRRWMRRLGWTVLGLVVAQGVLGGVTVLLKLPVVTSAAHACLAQAIFMLVVFIALALSPVWTRPEEPCSSALPGLAGVTTGAIYLQLVLGAVMRHMHAGLVIPDWPLSFGGLIPATFTPEIAVHFAHRTWAWGVAVLVVITALTALKGRGGPGTRVPAVLLLALTTIQISLGASIIWTQRHVWVTSAHVVTGALLLAVSLVLAVRARRAAATGMRLQPGREPATLGEGIA